MTRPISAISAGPEAQLAPGLVPAVEWATNWIICPASSVPVMSAKRFCASPANVLAWMSAQTVTAPWRASEARCSAAAKLTAIAQALGELEGIRRSCTGSGSDSRVRNGCVWYRR